MWEVSREDCDLRLETPRFFGAPPHDVLTDETIQSI